MIIMIEKNNNIVEEIAYNKNAISGYFKYIINPKDKNGILNQNYYYDNAIKFENNYNEKLKQNENLKERVNLLTTYNIILSKFIIEIVQLFIGYDKYNGSDETILNDISHSKIQIEVLFNSIKEYKQNIQYNINDGNTEIAIKIKNYCITLFNETKNLLKNSYFIDIEKSTLKNDFEEVLNELHKSINIDEIIFLNNINNTNNELPQQIEIGNTDGIVKDLHKDIFKRNGFEVFEGYKNKRLITVSSRTDLRIIFDLLKSDELFVQTIELKHYIRWINKEYFNNSISELRVQNLNSKPNILRVNDYKEIKKATLK